MKYQIVDANTGSEIYSGDTLDGSMPRPGDLFIMEQKTTELFRIVQVAHIIRTPQIITLGAPKTEHIIELAATRVQLEKGDDNAIYS